MYAWTKARGGSSLKRWRLYFLLLLLLCLTSCAAQQEAAGLLWIQNLNDLEGLKGLFDYGLCAVEDTLVLDTPAGPASVQPRMTDTPAVCTPQDEKTYRLLGGDGLYALDAQNAVYAVDLSAGSMAQRPVGRIAVSEDAAYLSKGVVNGARVIAMHLSSMGMSRAGSCVVYPLDGGEAMLAEENGVVDLCAYRDGKALLLCQKELSLELRILDPATGRQSVLATLEGTEGAGLAYESATDSIYLARSSGIWRVDRNGKAKQVGYLSWMQMPGSACAAVTSDGCYALYGRNNLLVYDLHAPEGNVASLTVSCPQFEQYCQGTLTAYQLANPQLNVSLTSYETSSGDTFLQHYYADSAADIIGLENLELLDDMIGKGYCADLSGSSVIASLVARMEPSLTERFCRDGKIYGVPYYAAFSELIPGIQPENAETLGISREEWPQDWMSLMDFLEEWADNPRLEAENISLLGVSALALNYRDALLRAITEQQLASCALEGIPATLDTPLFRALLARVDELTPLLTQLQERDSALYTPEGEPRRLLVLGYQMLTGDGDARMNGGCELLPLAWTEETGMLYPVHQGILLVNAGSSQQAEAIRLLEALLMGLESRSRALLMPEARVPVEYASYHHTLEELAVQEADYQARYDACTDEAQRREIQSAWERYRDSFAYALAMRYEITQASIDNLTQAQTGMVGAEYSSFYRQKSESIYTLYLRYVHGEIAAEQLMQEIERALEMSRLEEL